MTTLKQRFAEMALEYPEISQADLARATGASPPSVSAWFSGDTKTMKLETAIRAAALYRVSPMWLAKGEGQKTTSEQKSDSVNISGVDRHKNKTDDLVIPQFKTGGSMGGGLLLRDQPGVIQGWSVSREWVSKNVKSHTGASNLCIVTGFGDSMKGMYNPGDPLLVDSGVNSVKFDAVYFFRVGDEGFIKRLQRVPGEGLVALSENKAYKEWVIKEDMDFQVFGRVLKVWQSEDF